MIKRFFVVFALSLLTTPALAQIEFRQNNTALPPFGGYVPGSGATVAFSTSNGISLQGGNSSSAIPPFGGFLPGSGATLNSSTSNGFALQQGSFSAALPPFGGYVPGSGATLSFSSRRQLPSAANRQRSLVATPPVTGGGVRQPGVNQGDADSARQLRDARRRRAAEKLLRKGQRAAANGNLAAARTYYRRALKFDVGDVNQHIRNLEKR